MRARTLLPTLLVCAAGPVAARQTPPPAGGAIPPNYSRYTLNAGYTGEPQRLGWAASRIEEKLGRGTVAVPTGGGRVYVGWRMLKNDPVDVAFNVYRATDGGPAVRLNREPIRATTDFVDEGAPRNRQNAWFVRPVVDGREQAASAPAVLPANPSERPYLAIRLRADVDTRSIHKVGIGDLDGDGEYDFVVKRPGGVTDPGLVRRSEDTFKVEGYRSDGTFLWRNDLGWSIELGTWYSPMVVYDFNGDGKAEVALKTGAGDPRDASGRVFTGPEYVSVWDGRTGGEGQGQHTIKVADIDGDGADEILNGAIAIDHDGRILWSTRMGHGDRMYVTDVAPDRPGLEVVYIYEDPHPRNGFGLWDAGTGDPIFGIDEETADNQLGSALVADIDPAYPGMELWADRYFLSSRGERIPGEVPPQTGLVWWDADLLREIAHRGTISKWKGATLAGFEGQVMAWADIVGDWREEIVTYTDGELRIYTTTIPAADRRPTLMQDPIYRLDVAHRAMGYDMPPMTSFYLGVR